MKTYSSLYRALPVCTVLLGIVATLPADDRRIRIKIPNPIPRIINKIGQAGDFIARKAERIEIVEVAVGRPRHPMPPPLPRGSYIITTETTTHVPADPRYLDAYRDPRVNDTTRYLSPERTPQLPPLAPLPPSPLPAARMDTSSIPVASSTIHVPSVGHPSPDNTALPVRDPALARSIPPPAPSPAPRPVPSPSGVLPASTGNAEATAPLPPLPPFGRPVPGRPGMVYLPGTKEAPENMIDVRDIAPGTKVRDPLSKTVFRVP